MQWKLNSYGYSLYKETKKVAICGGVGKKDFNVFKVNAARLFGTNVFHSFIGLPSSVAGWPNGRPDEPQDLSIASIISVDETVHFRVVCRYVSDTNIATIDGRRVL